MAVHHQIALVLAVSLVATGFPQQQGVGRWVWGTRSSPGGVQQGPQARSASLVRNNDGGNIFRSITARSFPARRFPSNIYDVLDEKDSPDLRAPLQRQDFTRINSRHASRTPPPSIVTPGDIPYPFGARPVDLGDGTSISWVPDDTLPVGGPSNSNGHSAGHFKPTENEDPTNPDDEQEIDDERYTTLDKLNDNRSPTRLPNPNTYSKQILGGLHPDEVHYADKDLVIIRGGGFHLPYELNSLGDDLALNAGSRIKPEAAIGNELGEESKNFEAPVRVRPDELFAKVPLPLRFVNGNIPTIIRPKDFTERDSSTTETFRPLHQTQFQPLRVSPVDYQPSASEQYYDRSIPKREYSEWGFQTLDDSEDMIAQESNFGPAVAVALPPHQAVKRSANPKVVHYHYHSIGNNQNPIVNYQVDDKGVLTKGNRLVSGAVVQPQRANNGNIIPRVEKQRPTATRTSGAGNSELEDLSSGHAHNLVPKTQIPKRRPQPIQANQPTTQKPISLAGDTDVNFLPPLPRANPLAESGQPRFSHNPERIPQGTKSLKGRRPTRRFMEPRRLSIQQRSLRPRL